MSYEVIFDFLSSDERKELLVFSEKLYWEEGRQGTGYLKAAVPPNETDLISNLIMRSLKVLDRDDPLVLSYDCYILKYPPGSFIAQHKDDAPFGSRHCRLNAIISGSPHGGELYIERRKVELFPGDAYVFRPDIHMHSISPIGKEARYVWSFGVLK